MMLKRLVMVAALVFMIPAGLTFAMPGFESSSSGKRGSFSGMVWLVG